MAGAKEDNETDSAEMTGISATNVVNAQIALDTGMMRPGNR